MVAVAAIQQVERVPLTEVAPQLGGYWRAWGLLMRGQLDAERHGKRWFVSTAAVERERAAMASEAVA